ncbi:Cyclin-dependent kinases regulatory subunit (Cell division control protein cks1) [Recurvomyces mirabilis]|uniref:Cyclin-dependent kinases regulatory subunit n=1 Tax=Recurvomyces mirabilis TaxID=574656 RepID=A0AAE0TSM7_9PEZI|nr:Cyclin-dependent kinases regulatory subunit (Cell division control protein cks1) [Recurvomyces mirabilis]KAK5155767.1 Cyclin-dependent kinases regulatory subunit (Cell division control protein cks1) [Recurvomyces mirabilis]
MAGNTDIDFTRRNKKARLLTDPERDQLDEFIDSIHYSSRYNDDHCEYRHVQLPKAMLKKIPKDYFDGARGTLKLLWEDEWRGLGITQVGDFLVKYNNAFSADIGLQSLGWEHYEVHEPEPHILLFKRPINYQPPGQH